ncbi:MAG: methyltransferase domain-containing protein [Flavobacteriales bacterium]
MKEKPAPFYDAFYAGSDSYRLHYSDSPYFPLWVQMEFMLRPYRKSRILDIGCGSGQFACFLEDRGYKNYEGIDFSEQAIEMARAASKLPFRVADAFSPEVLNAPYDVVVSMEVLEHITRDQDLVKGVRLGTACFFTVPNFDSVAHVRFFKSDHEVRSRYFEYLDIQETGFVNNIYYIRAIRSDFSPSGLQRIMKTREKVTVRRFLSWVKQSMKRWINDQ